MSLGDILTAIVHIAAFKSELAELLGEPLEDVDAPVTHLILHAAEHRKAVEKVHKDHDMVRYMREADRLNDLMSLDLLPLGVDTMFVFTTSLDGPTVLMSVKRETETAFIIGSAPVPMS